MPIKNVAFPKLFQFAERCQTLTKNSRPRAFLQVDPYVYSYCGCKKSCTTLDGWNPMNNGINIINHLSTGAGFFPSTVSETSTICAIGQHQLSFSPRENQRISALWSILSWFSPVFLYKVRPWKIEAGANNSNHYRLYGCLWMFMVIILVIIYNLILSSRYYIVESHGKPTG